MLNEKAEADEELLHSKAEGVTQFHHQAVIYCRFHYQIKKGGTNTPLPKTEKRLGIQEKLNKIQNKGCQNQMLFLKNVLFNYLMKTLYNSITSQVKTCLCYISNKDMSMLPAM